MNAILVQKALPDDPAIIAMANLLHVSENEVLGGLLRLWVWADVLPDDGAAPGITAAWVDNFTRISGFGSALQKVGWLCVTDVGISFPGYADHFSKRAKTRAQTRKRVHRHRIKKRNAKVTQKALRSPHIVPSGLKNLPNYAADKLLCSRWDELVEVWRDAYPGVDILGEVRKAYAWEFSNASRRKKDHVRFLNGWIARNYERNRKPNLLMELPPMVGEPDGTVF